jgi:hypothetical protein
VIDLFAPAKQQTGCASCHSMTNFLLAGSPQSHPLVLRRE